MNASAGSGKTYRLVKAYVQLLISDEASSSAFVHIIAMTFTNKASAEMKERIIDTLDQLASTENYASNGLQIGLDLAREENISEKRVREKCRIALEGILHRYEDFQIMTIDKFNLRLIRSFGKDLDLPDDFEVILEEHEIIEHIVDKLLNELGNEQSKKLNDLIFAYAKNNIEEGTQWNFRRSLIEFGRILESEKNNALIEQLLSMDFSMENYRSLQREKKEISSHFLNLTNTLKTLIDQFALDSDLLPGKSITINAIYKLISYDDLPIDLVTPTFIKNLEAELKPGQVYPEEIKTHLYKIIHFHEEHIEEHTRLSLFLRNFFNMALLQYMADALAKVRNEEQLIRISEFNILISQLIKDETAPFIYEKLGTRIHHYLLDEFQDTSRLQWMNLVPLVRESVSHNKENLIVGDPKQSIYRFKNGVAEQFVELPAIYNPEKDPRMAEHSDYFSKMGEVEVLNSNWRSSPSIVGFNNGFFKAFAQRLPEKIANFYDALEQTPQTSLNGKISIYSKEEKVLAKDLLPTIIEWIKECEQAGYKRNEICILGDKNYDCNEWAIGLNAEGYEVISADSLLINSNLKVQLCIAYLKWRLKPSGQNEQKRFAELFFRIKDKPYHVYATYIVETKGKEGRTFRNFNDALFIKDHFGSKDTFFFKYEHIYDLLEGFYRLIGFDELQDPYLHHLGDIAFEFGLHKGPDLSGFIDEYEAKKKNIAVQIPESESAIQIMTIHKSKGLEFPVVMIPSMNFSNKVKSKFLTSVGEFIIYKDLTKSETLKTLKQLHDQESEQVLGDNINKCYVAMTRPKERLYIANYYTKDSFGKLFHDNLSENSSAVASDDVLEVLVEDGPRNQTQINATSEHLFEPKNISDFLWFPEIALQDKEELTEEEYLSPEMRYGNEFHLLISQITDVEKIKSTLENEIKNGTVSIENKARLQKHIESLLKTNAYTSLFEDAIEILSEKDIIISASEILRPDKIIRKKDATIVIDYKTGLPKPKDRKQVLQYKAELEKMNWPNVSAYLYYSANESLEAC